MPGWRNLIGCGGYAGLSMEPLFQSGVVELDEEGREVGVEFDDQGYRTVIRNPKD